MNLPITFTRSCRSLTFFYSCLFLCGPWLQAAAQINKDSVYLHPDQAATFPGGRDSMYAFINRSVKFPPAATAAHAEGDVYVLTVIDREGWISATSIYKSDNELLNDEAIRVVKSMPPWNPASMGGEPVNTKCAIPVSFRHTDPAKIFAFVEKMPSPTFDMFPYIRAHMQHPLDAQQNPITGRVVLKFVVNEDGSRSDVTLVKSANELLNKEALRILDTMPPFLPGAQNGRMVKVYFAIPFDF